MLRRLVVVPAYNEAKSLSELSSTIRATLPDWDVLVVDDGSTDETSHFHAPGVIVLHLPFNLGIGGAMQAGYRYAALHAYEVAVQVDGDGQHLPEEVPRLSAHMGATGADMVIGSRFRKQGGYRQSWIRALGTRIIRTHLRLLTGRSYSDCASGFRLVNKRVIQAFSYWYPDDYPEPEVLLHLHRGGFRVEEVSVRMNERAYGKSSISLSRGALYVAKVSFALLLSLIRRPWPEAIVGAAGNHLTPRAREKR